MEIRASLNNNKTRQLDNSKHNSLNTSIDLKGNRNLLGGTQGRRDNLLHEISE